MQRTQNALTFLLKTGICAVLAFGAFTQSQAVDAKADPTGTWSWTRPGRNGGPDRKTTLKLKVESGKLKGALIQMRRDQEVKTDIEKGVIKGNDISFAVTREFGGNSFTIKYFGKVTGDNIKGKYVFERNGESRDIEWEAKREKDKK